MNNFLNDYNDMGHPKMYEKLGTYTKNYSGYGNDEISERARELLRKEIGRNVEIQFVAGGTIANIVCCTANLRSIDGVLAATTGHISNHETGSIEATAHEVITVEREDGKLTPQCLEEVLSYHNQEVEVRIGLIYISQTTELGTVYTKKELQDLYACAKKHHIPLYIDGARLAVGLAASGMTLKDIADNCDVFTVGGTKNGALFGEAVIVTNEEYGQYFRYFMKQRGAVLAKTFVLGAMYEAFFEDGLYYENGKRAYEASRKLVRGIQQLGGKILYGGQSNQVFLCLKEEQIGQLEKENLFEINPHNNSIRLVTTYRTRDEEIESFLHQLEEIL